MKRNNKTTNTTISTGVNTKEHKTESVSIWMLSTVLLAAFVSYQYNTVLTLSNDLKLLSKNSNGVSPSSKINHTALPLDVNSIPVAKPEKNAGKHQKLPYYATHIPTEPENKFVPLDKDRIYTYDDFESVFGVTPIHQVIFDPVLKLMLKHHNVFEEEQYLDEKAQYDAKLEVYKDVFAKDSHEDFHREYLGVKWSSPETGFGLYAIKDIPIGTPLGWYSGVIEMDIENTDYTWEVYKANVTLASGRSEYVDIGINGLKAGNYLRFINHVGEDCNTKYAIHNNQWFVLYVTEKAIVKGQELTTNYGSQYFKERYNAVQSDDDDDDDDEDE
ncbi:hypothetical protein BC833DRAFT_278984 [Globomyces pollinis-pini]|nr:hypothetical protein BC833DRAFT_278984 [Globomyces pollinis-pini]